MSKALRALGLVLILALITVLVACSPISAGRITDKTVKASYTWVQQVCSAYGKNGICTIYTPIYHTEPERYVFDIRDEDGKDGYVYVSSGTFENYDIGDWFDAGN